MTRRTRTNPLYSPKRDLLWRAHPPRGYSPQNSIDDHDRLPSNNSAPLDVIIVRHRPHRIALDLRGLIGVNEILRLSGALERDPTVDIWFIDGGPVELQAIARKWFVQMRQCGDDVRELMHDGCPVACVEDAPFGYVNTFKSHVNVGFFHGAALRDPAGLLEGSGKRMRHVKLKPGRELNAAAVSDLIDAAYVDINQRLRAERSSPEG